MVTLSFGQMGVKKLLIEREIELPAETVWAILEDYGYVANSHPKIIKSDYLPGSSQAAEGCERVCYFNESGSRYLKEKLLNYRPEEMTYTNQVFAAGKFPVDPEYTRADYKVVPMNGDKCKLVFDMQYRTQPAFMGGMMKGKFRKLIEDYFISIEHYARTGEAVTTDNFKTIKKQYQS